MSGKEIVSEAQKIEFEKARLTYAPWFAGFLEEKGRMNFKETRHTLKGGDIARYFTPVIRIGSSDRTIPARLKASCGGSILHGTLTDDWYLGSVDAAALTDAMKPYVISREEEIAAFSNWTQKEKGEEFAIVKQEKQVPPEVLQAQYAEYLKNLYYMSAVLDALSFPETHTRRQAVHPRAFDYLNITSHHEDLLIALGAPYGQEPTKKHEAGENITEKGVGNQSKEGEDYFIHEDVFKLRLPYNVAKPLLDRTAAYSPLRSVV